MGKIIAFEDMKAQRAVRSEKVIQVLLEAYWETVDAIGRDEVAVLTSSSPSRTKIPLLRGKAGQASQPDFPGSSQVGLVPANTVTPPEPAPQANPQSPWVV